MEQRILLACILPISVMGGAFLGVGLGAFVYWLHNRQTQRHCENAMRTTFMDIPMHSIDVKEGESFQLSLKPLALIVQPV